MFEKILVCLDGSSLSQQVLPFAVDEAAHFGSKVVLLEVVEPMSASAPGTEPTPQELFEAETESRQESRARLEKIANKLRQEMKLDVEIMVLEGSIGETIVDYAQKTKIGLIAIATHGIGGIRRAVFGSVADYVLRNSEIPLLVIRPKAP
jgi:nucleotide-binding universal stress UspA family protein